MPDNTSHTSDSFKRKKAACCIIMVAALTIGAYYLIVYYVDNYFGKRDMVFNVLILESILVFVYIPLMLIVNPVCTKLVMKKIKNITNKIISNNYLNNTNSSDFNSTEMKYCMHHNTKDEFISLENDFKSGKILVDVYNQKRNMLIDAFILLDNKEYQIKCLFAEGIITESEFREKMDESLRELYT